MMSMKPFLEIEWRSRSFLLHIAISIIVFLALIGAIKQENAPLATSALSFSISSFVLLGIIWTLIEIEDLKNDQDSMLIKTFVSYPVTSLDYILSKQLPFLLSDLLSSFVGSLAAYAIIGNMRIESLELFVLATFFAVFASRALFFATTLISRIGFLPEVIVVFYYFSILSLTLALFGSEVKLILTLFPYLVFFENILSLHAIAGSSTSLVAIPAFYLSLILLAFLVLKIFNWRPLFKYD